MVDLTQFGHAYEEVLSTFVKRAKVETILELGVCTGVSTRAFLKALGGTGRLWSVDIYPRLEHTLKIQEAYPEWTFLVEDDLTLEWDRIVDLIFIDTSHVYKHTLGELVKFSPFARSWIFLHDTSAFPGPAKAIQEFLAEQYNWVCAEWAHHHGLALLMRKSGA